MSLKVERLENELLKSNTYLITHEKSLGCYIVDPGDYNPIKNRIKDLRVLGVFLTHSHIDHIYGLNRLYDDLVIDRPCVYFSKQCLKGLLDPKVNGSYYMSQAYVHKPRKYEIIFEGTTLRLFDDQYKLNVLETPGHSDDSLTFQLEKYLFTGDSFIPGQKIHTRSKSANKLDAKISLERIRAIKKVIICPGHGAMLNNTLF